MFHYWTTIHYTPERVTKTMSAQTGIRLAKKSDIEQPLVDMINSAYKDGEKDILVDTPQEPFQRVTAEDLRPLVARQQLLILEITISKADDETDELGVENSTPRSSSSSKRIKNGTARKIAGCIKLERVDHKDNSMIDAAAAAVTSTTIPNIPIKIGGWGCLAVSNDYQRRGYGNRLIQAAEDYLKYQWGCQYAQLELLAPSHWKHHHKEMLREWYTVRLGYRLLVPNSYEASTEKFKQGTALAGRFVLATDADYTTYRKKL